MIWGSVLWYFILDYFYNYVIGGPYVGSLTQAMKEATFWFTTVITVIMLMVPVLAARFYLIDVHPSLSDKVCNLLNTYTLYTRSLYKSTFQWSRADRVINIRISI